MVDGNPASRTFCAKVWLSTTGWRGFPSGMVQIRSAAGEVDIGIAKARLAALANLGASALRKIVGDVDQPRLFNGNLEACL